MGKIHQLFVHSAFDPEAVRVMGQAYDRVCEKLPLANHESVAKAILAAARNGEGDLIMLTQSAVRSLIDDCEHRKKA